MSSSPDWPVAEEVDDLNNCRGRSFAQVEFVAGDYLAFSGGSESNCGDKDNSWFRPFVGRMTRLTDRQFGVGADRAAIAERFGSRRLPALKRVAASLARTMVAEMKAELDWCCDAEFVRSLSEPDDVDWGLRRQRAETMAFGFVEWSRTYLHVANLPLVIADEVFGWHSSAVSWDSVVRAVPLATDAFRSPKGGLLVVVTPTQVLAFMPSSSRVLRKPVLEIYLGDNLDSGETTWWGTRRGTAAVMAEWATGNSIPRWTSAVGDLSRRPRPPVRVTGAANHRN